MTFFRIPSIGQRRFVDLFMDYKKFSPYASKINGGWRNNDEP